MAGCPSSADCVFYQTIEPSIVKRVRYASVYSYCRGGEHAACALYDKIAAGLPVVHNLMPDGSIGFRRSNGIMFLLTVMPQRSRTSSACRPVAPNTWPPRWPSCARRTRTTSSSLPAT